MKPSVYNYSDPVEFMLAVLNEKKQKNPRFSLRAWSKQLKLSQPILLSRVLKSQRPINAELTRTLCTSLSMNGDERRYFELLVLHKNCVSIEQKEATAALLRSSNPGQQFSSLEVDEFRLIADWYHPAILELAELKDFRNDAKWIAERLGEGVTVELVERALDRLLRLGLLHKNEAGRLHRKDMGPLRISGQKSSEAVRQYHRQMIDKAVVAIDGQKLEQRYLAATTLPVTQAAVEEIKKIIMRCQEELAGCASRGEAEHVYQVNFQLFQLA